jgi:hypothetical protein
MNTEFKMQVKHELSKKFKDIKDNTTIISHPIITSNRLWNEDEQIIRNAFCYFRKLHLVYKSNKSILAIFKMSMKNRNGLKWL